MINSNAHFILPVIHVGTHAEPAIENARLAFEEGVDGVFIIGHGYGGDLIDLARRIKYVGTERWVGVNRLGVFPHVMVKHSIGLDAVWTDNAEIEEHPTSPTTATSGRENEYAEYTYLLAQKHKIAYFGGVAFKYQRHVDDLEHAAAVASEFTDFICTSGPGTGQAVEVEKIKRLASAAIKPIAIASGITPENVTEYLPYAKAFLVATGISLPGDFYNLNRELVARLVATVRSYSPTKVGG